MVKAVYTTGYANIAREAQMSFFALAGDVPKSRKPERRW
jgi:hypothetical protein